MMNDEFFFVLYVRFQVSLTRTVLPSQKNLTRNDIFHEIFFYSIDNIDAGIVRLSKESCLMMMISRRIDKSFTLGRSRRIDREVYRLLVHRFSRICSVK